MEMNDQNFESKLAEEFEKLKHEIKFKQDCTKLASIIRE